MNVIWRTIIVLWRARLRLRREGPLDPMALGRIRVTTLPTDIDLLGHMNNGRYLSLFDLGRFDLLVRTGVWDVVRRRGWYSVVANATVSFRRSLQLWQRFDIETRIVGVDERAVYVEHRAVVDDEIYARVILRARFLRRGGGVLPTAEVLEALGVDPASAPAPEPWLRQWAEDAALPSTRRPAPSRWS